MSVNVASESVSVVIPVYGATPLLVDVVHAADAALKAHGAGGEILLVDDASPEPVVFADAVEAPCRVIRNESNQGFGATANRGVHEAANRLVLLLNSDMLLAQDAIALLVAGLAEDDLAASPSIMIRDENGPCESASYFFLRRGLLNVGHLGMADRSLLPGEPCDIGYCCGGAMLAWRHRFLELGGFSPVFSPFYWEDADLGWRGWERGLRSRFVPAARAVHVHGQTIGKRDPRQVATVKSAHQLLLVLGDVSGVGPWAALAAWAPVRLPLEILRGRMSLAVARYIWSRRRALLTHRRLRAALAAGPVSSRTVLSRFSDMARRGGWGTR